MNGVRVGVVHEVNYINPVLSVCTEGQTYGTNPNSVICNPFGLADNDSVNAIRNKKQEKHIQNLPLK